MYTHCTRARSTSKCAKLRLMPSSLRAVLHELTATFVDGVLSALRTATLDDLVSFAVQSGRHVDPAAGIPLPDRVANVATEWGTRYRLTAAHEDILRRAALGEQQAQIAKVRGSSPTTVKKHAADLLKRTKDPNLQAAALRLLREAAEG